MENQDELWIQARWVASALIVSLVISCSGERGDGAVSRDSVTPAPSPAAVEPPPWDSSSVAGLDCEDLEREILASALNRSALEEAFGTPDSIESRTEPNRHLQGATDSLFTVYYPGMVMSLRKPSQGQDLASGLEVSRNRYLRYPTIGIGSPADRVVRVLGPPQERDDRKIVYDCGIGAEQPVTFALEEGVVRGVNVAFYVD